MLQRRLLSPASPATCLGSLSRLVPLLLIAAIVLPMTGCAKNAATGDRRLMLLSRAEENALGAQAAPEFTAEFGGATESAALQAYVTEIGARMAAETEADFPGLDWEFTLLDSSVVNAFALPGGKVFITRGLAERLQDESEIAGVIGHEIGHVTAQHANSRISKQTLFTGGLQTIAAVLAVAPEDNRIASVGSATLPALQVGGSLLLLKYGRDEELEADELGMRYMSRVGYDPSGQQRVMQLLAALSGGESGFDWFASHPEPAYRVQRISEILAEQYRDVPMVGDGRFASRFQTRFLTPASRLPAPRHPGASASAGSEGDVLAAALGHGWCGVCASAPIFGPQPAD
jgi:predicted Zn-dependent protease